MAPTSDGLVVTAEVAVEDADDPGGDVDDQPVLGRELLVDPIECGAPGDAARPGAKTEAEETHHESDADRNERCHAVRDTGRVLDAYEAGASTDGAPGPVMVFASERELDRGALGQAHGGGVGETPITRLDRAGRQVAESRFGEAFPNCEPTLRGSDAVVGVGVRRPQLEPDDLHHGGDERSGERPPGDTDADRVDHCRLLVGGRPSEEPAQCADGPQRGGSDEVLGTPSATDEVGLDGVVDDEAAEPFPPRAANVDGEVSRRNGPIGREPGHHVLQHQSFVRSKCVTLVGGGGRADPSQLLEIVFGRQDAQPPSRCEIDHGRPESGCGDVRVVREEIDHGRGVRTQRPSSFCGMRAWRHQTVACAQVEQPAAGGRQHSEPEPCDGERRREHPGSHHRMHHGAIMASRRRSEGIFRRVVAVVDSDTIVFAGAVDGVGAHPHGALREGDLDLGVVQGSLQRFA